MPVVVVSSGTMSTLLGKGRPQTSKRTLQSRETGTGLAVGCGPHATDVISTTKERSRFTVQFAPVQSVLFKIFDLQSLSHLAGDLDRGNVWGIGRQETDCRLGAGAPESEEFVVCGSRLVHVPAVRMKGEHILVVIDGGGSRLGDSSIQCRVPEDHIGVA